MVTLSQFDPRELHPQPDVVHLHNNSNSWTVPIDMCCSCFVVICMNVVCDSCASHNMLTCASRCCRIVMPKCLRGCLLICTRQFCSRVSENRLLVLSFARVLVCCDDAPVNCSSIVQILTVTSRIGVWLQYHIRTISS